MATCSYAVSTEKSQSSSANYHRHFAVDTLNEGLNKKILPYSKINSVIAKFTAKRSGVNLSTSNTDARIYFDNEASVNGGITVGKWSDAIGTSYKEFSADITQYCGKSETANAGIISPSGNYTRLYFASIGSTLRTHYIGSLGVYWDYTLPTFVISLTAGTGGTVSGAGTYNVGSTATIKATPNSGYRFVKWSDGNTNAERQITITSSDISANVTNLSYTATFEKTECTVNFKNQDGSVVKTSKIQQGKTLGTLPTVSRNGYTFVGWIPCAPAIKTDGSVLDSCQYDGSTAYPLDKKYKYTDKLSVHIEAYMSNWEDIKNLKSQIASCTEGGGWGLGYMANTTGNGSEIYAGGYKGIDLGFNTPSNFSNNTWYAFDIVFSNGTFEVYLNGTKKGTQTTTNTTISYHSDNTIFVGAEAAKSATTPGGNYFKGYISNVFIANQGTRLQIATTSTVVNGNIDYYPVWRKNTKINKIFVGTSQPKAIYIGTQEVKEVYIGTTKVYG